ncbi:GTPase [endosymbiont of Pachyrhynchus infernalis]|uniref:GTPase n=1 Tax=endosymbiont of Pachyrhynchus infernalis TaxID=1971488 RepID=UPI000DC71584|nr:GTPase [endosymbiont of Pachyrhynchus infernalis]BBA84948.1 GTPase Obg [endosymbiont of Pachyrhynchus infernalis]
MKNFYETIITVYAGNGGNGNCSFSKSSKKLFSGKPDGGNGGNGGNIFIFSNKSINNLLKINNKKIFKAENGRNGLNNKCNGRNGKNLIINVPINTKIYNLDTSELIDNLDIDNKIILVAKGGNKGLGNFIFKSSINRSPKNFTNGKKGEIRKLKLIFNLRPNVCILGMVNSGKSSLINLISNSNSKIDNYPFTTKYPILGTLFSENYKKISILDTPAIFNNIYKNKYLNLNIFKYFEKCNLILYIIDSSIINQKFIYDNINIINYIINDKLICKNIWIVFNKLDLVNNIFNFNKIIKFNFNNKYKYYIISCLNKFNINNLLLDINNFIDKNMYLNIHKYENKDLNINWN